MENSSCRWLAVWIKEAALLSGAAEVSPTTMFVLEKTRRIGSQANHKSEFEAVRLIAVCYGEYGRYWLWWVAVSFSFSVNGFYCSYRAGAQGETVRKAGGFMRYSAMFGTFSIGIANKACFSAMMFVGSEREPINRIE